MIKLWFAMKKNELKVKAQIYSVLNAYIDNNKDIISFAQKLYGVLKDVPIEELRSEFVSKIAEIIHEENNGSASL